MTKNELSQCNWLNRKIEQLKTKLEELEDSEIKPINLTGMPSGGGISDHTAKIATERAETERLISLKREEYMIERARIERYIDTVEGERMQDILRLRHINGLTWRQISQEMGGSEKQIKRLYYDFMKKT